MPTITTLIVGLGNPTRGDDAAGGQLADRVSGLRLPGVEVRITQQLTPELAEAWSRCRRVLVLDAAVAGPDVDLRRLTAADISRAESSHSHSLSPATVAGLALQLYGRCAEVWLCALRVEATDFSEGLSPGMRARLEQAWNRLQPWLHADAIESGETPPRSPAS